MTRTGNSTQYRLLVFGDGSVRTVALNGSRWIIGRAGDCDITLRDPTVSRRHLLLERRGDEFHFQDLGGSNPILCDGRALRQGTLAVGQVLAIGLSRLSLELRHRPSPLAAPPVPTVVLSREVADDDLPAGNNHDLFVSTARRVLERIEWTFADLGDLADAAEPLLSLSLNLTRRRGGWIGRFDGPGTVEMLATLDSDGRSRSFQLPEATLLDARRIARPHLLTTQEASQARHRLVVPLGPVANGLMVLEDPEPDAPDGQELLRLADSLGKVVWHRLQETAERLRLRADLERLRFHGTPAHHALLASARLQQARDRARDLVLGGQPVLLVGEPGTELLDLARYLHAESPRRNGPFVSWNPERTPPSHHDRALLGDAGSGEPGCVQRARGGVLFLEELAQLAPTLQLELVHSLRAAPPGGDAPLLFAAVPRAADVAATAAAFGWQPHHRVDVPPLRGHPRDILALAELFLSELGSRPDGAARLLTERARRQLLAHSWPGNVRELRLVVEAAAAAAGNQPIAPRHLPPELAAEAAATPELLTLEAVERQHIREVMERTGGNRVRAAQLLGIATSTLYEKLKRFQIDL